MSGEDIPIEVNCSGMDDILLGKIDNNGSIFWHKSILEDCF